MDALATDRPSRSSRWSRDPILDQGKPVVAYLTERDIEIFKLLARFPYLSTEDIHAFVGDALKPLVRRLNLLFRKPNLYINRPPQQHRNATANTRPLIYELDNRGWSALRERGMLSRSQSHPRNFAHELMVCRVLASIELGVRADPALRLISWPEILASENTPSATCTASRPERIPASYEHHGERQTTEVVADGAPFGLERTHSGKHSYLFFPGIEADCCTEPIDSSNIERSSIYKKFLAYRAIVATGTHHTHFGFPNFFVPFIAPTRTRLDSMMRLLERITDGRGSKIFLFKTFPIFTSPERRPPASGHMLTEPWLRVGFEALHLTR